MYEKVSLASLSVDESSPIVTPAEFSLKTVEERATAVGAVLSNTEIVKVSDFVDPLLSVEVTVIE